MSPRITDDELARRIVDLLHVHDCYESWSVREIARAWARPTSESAVRRRLRALRDEGRVVEVNGPRGSLWRLP